MSAVVRGNRLRSYPGIGVELTDFLSTFIHNETEINKQ